MKTPASLRHLKIAGILVLSVLIAAIIGYMLIERLSFIDALYLAIDMMATIGSTTPRLTESGRVFTIFVIIFGVGSLLYTLSAGMEFMIEGHFSQVVRRYFMDNKEEGDTVIAVGVPQQLALFAAKNSRSKDA